MYKKRIFSSLILILCILLIFLVFLYANHNIGITKANIQNDIRKSQKITDSWITDGTASHRMAAFLSYPEDKKEHTFSIYVNRPGLSFGYFFRGGGSLSTIAQSILEISIEGFAERAFLSMNTQNIVRLEIDDGTTIEKLDLDKEKPFALVLPENAGVVTFYDIRGNIVKTIKQHF